MTKEDLLQQYIDYLQGRGEKPVVEGVDEQEIAEVLKLARSLAVSDLKPDPVFAKRLEGEILAEMEKQEAVEERVVEQGERIGFFERLFAPRLAYAAVLVVVVLAAIGVLYKLPPGTPGKEVITKKPPEQGILEVEDKAGEEIKTADDKTAELADKQGAPEAEETEVPGAAISGGDADVETLAQGLESELGLLTAAMADLENFGQDLEGVDGELETLLD